MIGKVKKNICFKSLENKNDIAGGVMMKAMTNIGPTALYDPTIVILDSTKINVVINWVEKPLSCA